MFGVRRDDEEGVGEEAAAASFSAALCAGRGAGGGRLRTTPSGSKVSIELAERDVKKRTLFPASPSRQQHLL